MSTVACGVGYNRHATHLTFRQTALNQAQKATCGNVADVAGIFKTFNFVETFLSILRMGVYDSSFIDK